MTTRGGAIRVAAIAALAGGAFVGHGARRTQVVVPLDLRTEWAALGDWHCAEIGDEQTEADGSVVKQSARYENGDGGQVDVSFVLTATRLGALRDYSVALEAQGWVIVRTDIVGGPHVAHLNDAMRYRLQHLRKRDSQRLACIWFVSPNRQAASLSDAELSGWLDLVLKSSPPLWAEFYAVAAVAGDAEASRRQVEDLAGRIGPALAETVRARSS